MKNIESYERFLSEAEGISLVIYRDLKEYFEKDRTPNFVKAKSFIKKKNKGWELSKEDYKEAKKEFEK